MVSQVSRASVVIAASLAIQVSLDSRVTQAQVADLAIAVIQVSLVIQAIQVFLDSAATAE